MESKFNDGQNEYVVLDQCQSNKLNNNIFQIGHEQGLACTKLPEFNESVEQNLVYGDIVSLLDAEGDGSPYVLKFLWQHIFRLANSVRFMVLLTVNEFSDRERD